MTEDLFDIYEVLKFAPKGMKLYSTQLGDVYFREATGDDIDSDNRCISVADTDGKIHFFDAYGSTLDTIEEPSLFPSKDDQDWTFWQAILIETTDIVQIDNKPYLYIGKKEYDVDGEIEELDTFLDSEGDEITGDLLECGFANKQQIQAYELAFEKNK